MLRDEVLRLYVIKTEVDEGQQRVEGYLLQAFNWCVKISLNIKPVEIEQVYHILDQFVLHEGLLCYLVATAEVSNEQAPTTRQFQAGPLINVSCCNFIDPHICQYPVLRLAVLVNAGRQEANGRSDNTFPKLGCLPDGLSSIGHIDKQRS